MTWTRSKKTQSKTSFSVQWDAVCLVCLMTLELGFNKTSLHFEEWIFFSLEQKNNLLVLRFWGFDCRIPRRRHSCWRRFNTLRWVLITVSTCVQWSASLFISESKIGDFFKLVERSLFCALIEVHRWWHTQGNSFPHTRHHCQTPAVPSPARLWSGGGGERCPKRWRDSLWSHNFFFFIFPDDAVCLFPDDAAPVWLKERRWMRHAKWCPEEKEPTETMLPSSLPPVGDCSIKSFHSPHHQHWARLLLSLFFVLQGRAQNGERKSDSPQVVASPWTVAFTVRSYVSVTFFATWKWYFSFNKIQLRFAGVSTDWCEEHKLQFFLSLFDKIIRELLVFFLLVCCLVKDIQFPLPCKHNENINVNTIFGLVNAKKAFPWHFCNIPHYWYFWKTTSWKH